MKWQKTFLTAFLIMTVSVVSGAQTDCTGPSGCKPVGASCSAHSDCCSGTCYFGAGGKKCIGR
jgi:hypothetical protein